jgi:hypothetical protein
MKITNLTPGTKLMWDAPLPFDGYLGKHAPERLIYPALIIYSAPPNVALKECRRVKTGHSINWMGPDVDNLREPTKEELNALTWPTLDKN